MTSKRFFFILIGLTVLVVIAGVAGVVVGDKRLRRQSEVLGKLKIESAQLDNQQTVLVQAKKDVAKYRELTNIVKAIVPQEKDQARTVRELVKLAGESNIGIASISFPSSTLGQTAAPGTPAPAAPTTPTTQVKPVTGISGVYQMDITLQTAGQPVSYANLLTFLRKLETNRRTAHVTSMTIQPDTTNRNLVTFNLTLSVFLKP